MKNFKDYLIEATGEITFAWGRMNPPTVGHEKLLDATKRAASGKYVIYLSQSQDKKKNPLSYEEKVKFARKMFPRHARNIMLDKGIKTIFDLLTKFHNEGYTKVTLVAGSDRVMEFEALLSKYNNVQGRHGFYNFESINVVSAGERDPDAEGVEGMSASKMRAAASANDLELFYKGLPKNYKEGEKLFNAVRTGMGLKESKNYRKHIQLPAVSKEREAFVNGNLFEEGDKVRIKISNKVGTIKRLGSNYVIVDLGEDTKPTRQWLDSIELIERGFGSNSVFHDMFPAIDNLIDRFGPGKKRWKIALQQFSRLTKENPKMSFNDRVWKAAQIADVDVRALRDLLQKSQNESLEWGTDEATKAYADMTPGQSFYELKKAYGGDLSKSTKDKRQAQFNKQAKMDDNDPNAYKPAPGDARAKTKPSKYTKKYHQMYGEAKELQAEDVKKALKNKSEKSGISYDILKKVFDRGVAAWRTGHRPGTTPTQWGLARVNSYITKGKTYHTTDSDLRD